MVSSKFSLVGVLVMGILIQNSASGASLVNDRNNDTYNDNLIQLMNKSGIKTPVDLERRSDLGPMALEAAQIAKESGCVTEELSEVRVGRESNLQPIGYEAFAQCEDSPTPALGIYFDVNHKYIGNFAFGN